MSKLSLILYYTKYNKYGLRAILSALENHPYLVDKLNVFFCYNEHQLKSILRKTRNKNKRISCFSFFSTQYDEIESLKNVLEKESNLIKIAGGPFPTTDPLFFLKKGFDYVFLGEGEESFPLFLEKIIEKEDPKQIKGIAYQDEKEIVIKRRASFCDINKFLPVSEKFHRFGPIEITRGCKFRCKFCSTPFLFGSCIRHRDVEVIVETVKIMKKYGYTQIRFLSPNAFSYQSQDNSPDLKSIYNLLENVRKIVGEKGKIFFGSFPSEVRPEFVNKELLDLLKKYVNNDNIVVGAQSGSNRMLKLINRGHSKEEVLRATEVILKSGFKAYIDIIIGFPQETYEDRKDSINFMKELIKMGAKPHLHYFVPLSGTPLYRSKPTSIEKEFLKILNIWEAEGKIFGKWRNQKKLSFYVAEKIAKTYN